MTKTTTDQVRLAFTDHEWERWAESDATPEVRRGQLAAGSEFDAWLAGVKAAAWYEGVAATGADESLLNARNPYDYPKMGGTDDHSSEIRPGVA